MDIKEKNYWLIYMDSEYSDHMKALPFETMLQLIEFTSTRQNLKIISISKTI